MRWISIIVGLSMLLLSTAALADVPGLINYQGTLMDEHGVALDTTVSMTFSIYADSTGVTTVWTEIQPSVLVSHGMFNILLGSMNALSDTVFSAPSRWLGVQVGVDPELEPRQRIVSVGYAFWAAEAETADYVRSGGGGGDDGDWTISGEDMYSAVLGNVGIGTDNPLYKLHVYHSGSGNYGYMGSSNYGVRGYSSSGSAVYGSHSSGNYGYMGSSNYGVYGQGSSSASAVYGSHSSGNYGYLGSNGYGVFAYSGNGYGVHGYHSSGNYGFLGSDEYGVYGDGSVAGVYGSGSGGYGVHGYSSANHGVYGHSIAGSGVYGSHEDGNYGFLGSSDFGVYAYSSNGYGVRGRHTSGNYGYLGSSSYGVYGSHDGGNYGYIGSSDFGVRGYSSSGHAVYGNSGTGSGVRGSSTSGKGVNGFSNSGWAVYGEHASGNYGSIGTSSHGMLAHLVTTDPGDYAVCGYGIDDSGEDGTNYGASSSLGGVKGYNIYGNQYTFGVAGYSHLDSVRSGGCFGGREDAAVWGCFGYKNSGGSEYGGYATSWDSGGGKGQVSTGIGFGSWGELFGADIHGKIYGIYAEGGNYALYTNGAVFKNDIDVHLQDTETPSMAVLYTNVSTDVTVQTSGFSTLSKGVSYIKFDDDFKEVASSKVPIVVTVTPTGDCNGVHVAEVTKDGFTVVENNAGKSDVTVAFIAIGRRVGHENPRLPAEVISSDYVDRLSRGLHNDAHAERDGEGLYFESGRLYVGRHPSTLTDQQRPREQLEDLKEEHGELLEVQERESLERKRMKEEARRMEKERLRMLELQRQEGLERKRTLEAEEGHEIEQR
jgi:hypothetical protein